MMVPPFPPNVRFASAADLYRLAFVAAAGYVDAPQSAYMRPYFQQYPQDTIAGFYSMYRSDLLNPKAVVLVIEDDFAPNEKDDVCEVLRSVPVDGSSGSRVVVAAATIHLPETCQWVKARAEKGIVDDIPTVELLKRDSHPEGLQLVRAAVVPRFKENGVGTICAMLQTMVLHPAYRGRRHGDALVKWMCGFLEELGTGYYCAATPAGRKLYMRHGAIDDGSVWVPAYSEHPEPFEIYFCKWNP